MLERAVALGLVVALLFAWGASQRDRGDGGPEILGPVDPMPTPGEDAKQPDDPPPPREPAPRPPLAEPAPVPPAAPREAPPPPAPRDEAPPTKEDKGEKKGERRGLLSGLGL